MSQTDGLKVSKKGQTGGGGVGGSVRFRSAGRLSRVSRGLVGGAVSRLVDGPRVETRVDLSFLVFRVTVNKVVTRP